MPDTNETVNEAPGLRAGVNNSIPAGKKSQSLHPMVELTTMRVREFLREKEAVFWVFIFPVLMTFALGIAFRNTGPDKTPVAIEAATTDARVSEMASVLQQSPEISATVMSPDEAARALRSGKVSIVTVVPTLAQQLDRALVRRREAFEYLNGRSLPCSVWTKQTKTLASKHFEVELVDGCHVGKSFYQTRAAQCDAPIVGHR